MSAFEDDIDDELLELAGATDKKPKRRQGTSSKSSASRKRKAE
jgi:RNA polymerase-associated protein RTF1